MHRLSIILILQFIRFNIFNNYIRSHALAILLVVFGAMAGPFNTGAQVLEVDPHCTSNGVPASSGVESAQDYFSYYHYFSMDNSIIFELVNHILSNVENVWKNLPAASNRNLGEIRLPSSGDSAGPCPIRKGPPLTTGIGNLGAPLPGDGRERSLLHGGTWRKP